METSDEHSLEEANTYTPIPNTPCMDMYGIFSKTTLTPETTPMINTPYKELLGVILRSVQSSSKNSS